ncbi:MAG: hypothetical protein RMY28_037755 [Nostoc sp. ChiSLP01]
MILKLLLQTLKTAYVYTTNPTYNLQRQVINLNSSDRHYKPNNYIPI